MDPLESLAIAGASPATDDLAVFLKSAGPEPVCAFHTSTLISSLGSILF